jgi:hypothetical protein
MNTPKDNKYMTFRQIAVVVQYKHKKRYTPEGIRTIFDGAMDKVRAELAAWMDRRRSETP